MRPFRLLSWVWCVRNAEESLVNMGLFGRMSQRMANWLCYRTIW